MRPRNLAGCRSSRVIGRAWQTGAAAATWSFAEPVGVDLCAVLRLGKEIDLAISLLKWLHYCEVREFRTPAPDPDP